MITHIFKDGTQSKSLNKVLPIEVVERVRDIADREPVNEIKKNGGENGRKSNNGRI